MPSHYAIELDFGTASVRALLVDVASGEEIATGVSNYRHGADGVIVDSRHEFCTSQAGNYLSGHDSCGYILWCRSGDTVFVTRRNSNGL